MNHVSEIENLFGELVVSRSYFPKDDLLCNINREKVIDIDEIGEKTKNKIFQIHKESKKNLKETGVNITCLSRGILRINDNTFFDRNIPIFLFEIQIQPNFIDYKILDEEKPILNPYLLRVLKLNPHNNYSNFEDLKKELIGIEFELLEKPEYIGNFHPFRYEILKDILEIYQSKNYSNNLKKLLFDETENEFQLDSFQDKFLSVPDKYQLNALKLINKKSFVLQGPPGTGKTKTISMVIEQALMNNQKVLVTSEKKAAIDSLYQNLKKNKLHFFCLLNHSSFDKKLVIKDLKESWDHYQLFNEPPKTELNSCFSLSSIINQMTSNPLPPEIDYKTVCSYSNFQPKKIEVSKIPIQEFTSFLNYCETNKKIIFSIVNKFQKSNLNLKEFEADTKNALLIIEKLNKIKPIKTIDDIHEIVRTYSLIQKFSSELYQRWMPFIIKYSKKIGAYHKEIIKLKSVVSKLEKEIAHWIKKPTTSELKYLKKLTIKKGLFSSYRVSRHWKYWTRSPQLKIDDEIEKMYDFLNAEQKLDLALSKIRLLGINDINELELIVQIRYSTKKSDWDKFQTFDENLITEFEKVNVDISKFKDLLSDYFKFNLLDDIPKFLRELEAEKNNVFEILKEISSKPQPILNLLNVSNSIEELKGNYFANIWYSFYKNNPIPSEKMLNIWIEEALNYYKNRMLNCESNAYRLRLNFVSKFHYFNELVGKTNSKLSEEEKKLKERLKKGKSLLVKEFAKRRNHKSLRELYNSEAREWLMILKPILIVHPQRLGNYFSPDKYLFDLGIIDEASQMPLSNAIGTLQRAKRIMIAGDFQQMPPKQFFKQSNIDEPSILHQAKYNLPNIQLFRHYRSENKDLIAFSNKYFYNNGLQVIENAKYIGQKSIVHHFVQDGIFDGRVNEVEAQKVARYIDSFINKLSAKETLGIVAFSELQMDCIKKFISPDNQILIEKKIEEDQMFFKALDQVQGDECDHLVISFGYSKNKDGKFEMRFGPINQIEGEKRLNVLFSRAKKQIAFFSSVNLTDFPESKNEGVNMIKNWFKFLNDTQKTVSRSSVISVFEIIKQSTDADDFTHLVWLYHHRGWTISTS
jgi:superfamily I DNA and/or RNA helicase